MCAWKRLMTACGPNGPAAVGRRSASFLNSLNLLAELFVAALQSRDRSIQSDQLLVERLLKLVGPKLVGANLLELTRQSKHVLPPLGRLSANALGLLRALHHFVGHVQDILVQ